jgi:hypothetical protein
MKNEIRIRFAAITTGVVISVTSCLNLTPLSDEPVTFAQVKPILQSQCMECHNSRYQFAQLNLETRSLAMKGGRSGPVIKQGSPQQSLLYRVLLLGHDNPVAMPPKPERIAREQEQLIHDWILQGAPWPEGKEGRLSPPTDLQASR